MTVGATIFRDKTDESPVELIPMTDDFAAFEARLRGFAATGGGDYLEHVALGLNGALNLLDGVNPRLRESHCVVKSMVFLIGDAGAPPLARTRPWQ